MWGERGTTRAHTAGVASFFALRALYPHRAAYDNLASPLRSPRLRLPANEARERIGVSPMTVHRDLDEFEHQYIAGEFSGGVTTQPPGAFEPDHPRPSCC